MPILTKEDMAHYTSLEAVRDMLLADIADHYKA